MFYLFIPLMCSILALFTHLHPSTVHSNRAGHCFPGEWANQKSPVGKLFINISGSEDFDRRRVRRPFVVSLTNSFRKFRRIRRTIRIRGAFCSSITIHPFFRANSNNGFSRSRSSRPCTGMGKNSLAHEATYFKYCQPSLSAQ